LGWVFDELDLSNRAVYVKGARLVADGVLGRSQLRAWSGLSWTFVSLSVDSSCFYIAVASTLAADGLAIEFALDYTFCFRDEIASPPFTLGQFELRVFEHRFRPNLLIVTNNATVNRTRPEN